MFTRTKKTTNRAESEPAQAPVETDVELAPRRIRIGDSYAATLVIVGYPAEVGLGWLEPLLAYPGRVDVSLHVEPVAPKTASDQLRRQMAKFVPPARAPNKDGWRISRPRPRPRTPARWPPPWPAANPSSTGSGCT